MKKHQIKLNDTVLIEIPHDENDWEVKIYISQDEDGNQISNAWLCKLVSLKETHKGIK